MKIMKNTQKGFIMPLLLAIIAILLVGGGAYVYTQKKQIKQSGVASSTSQVTSTAQTTPVPQDNSGKILLGYSSSYENLSPEEKAIVDEYNTYVVRRNNPALENVDPSQFPYDERSLSYLSLKYYDPTKILITRANVKGVATLNLIGRKDWKEIGENIGSLWMGGGYVESNGYAISVGNDGIFYYKAGDSTISSVPNSKLGSGETYEESSGMGGGNYTIAFDEPKKTLTVTVYHGDLYGNGNGQKIRTVKFVLP